MLGRESPPRDSSQVPVAVLSPDRLGLEQRLQDGGMSAIQLPDASATFMLGMTTEALTEYRTALQQQSARRTEQSQRNESINNAVHSAATALERVMSQFNRNSSNRDARSLPDLENAVRYVNNNAPALEPPLDEQERARYHRQIAQSLVSLGMLPRESAYRPYAFMGVTSLLGVGSVAGVPLGWTFLRSELAAPLMTLSLLGGALSLIGAVPSYWGIRRHRQRLADITASNRLRSELIAHFRSVSPPAAPAPTPVGPASQHRASRGWLGWLTGAPATDPVPPV